MSEIKLFELGNQVKERNSSNVALEKDLQTTIENNMEEFFGVRFLDTEFIIENGRIDSIGIDENNSPVIFEYKRRSSENVITQGLFYLNKILEHKEAFELLVLKKLGKEVSDNIDWSVPAVICVARDFWNYDIEAVDQIGANIKLVKYYKYGEDLLMFEHLNAPKVKPNYSGKEESGSSSNGQKTHVEKLKSLNDKIKELYDNVCNYIEALGDDIVANQLKYYLAYKTIQNLICIEVYNTKIILRMKIDPKTVELEEGFTRDVSNLGHLGTGDFEVEIDSDEDFQKAKPLIDRAYEEA